MPPSGSKYERGLGNCSDCGIGRVSRGHRTWMGYPRECQRRISSGARSSGGVTSAGDRPPVAVTAHYLALGKPGPVTVSTTVEKVGWRFSTARATLSDRSRPLVAVLGSFGEIESHWVEKVTAVPADMPGPDDCVPMMPTDTFPPPFVGKVELRLHPDDAALNTGQARIRGWFRLRDGEPIDSFALLIASDAFPPTIFSAQIAIGWAPTLELTVHIRNRPKPGWIRCSFSTRFITGGMLEADGELWDESGQLVALSRQLALLPNSTSRSG